MGCFDYGCAVTNVAIKQYEPVLHVVVLDKSIDNVYEIILALDTYKREKDISRRVFLREHRYQLSDEDRQEIANQAAEAMLKCQFMINFGTYNDMGDTAREIEGVSLALRFWGVECRQEMSGNLMRAIARGFERAAMDSGVHYDTVKAFVDTTYTLSKGR